MALISPDRPIRQSTGVFTNEELDYFDSLGPEYFPSEETHPVGETDWHYLSINTAFQLLHLVFPEPSDVYISANHFIYWDRTQKGLVVGPDLYVVRGAGRRLRSSYKVWEENGKVPDVVFEFASETTSQNDLEKKRALYEQTLKVPEYFLFDPLGQFYPEKLQGYRLSAGTYQPIAHNGDRLYSEQLNLELVSSGILLRFVDARTGIWIPTAEENEKARRDAEAAAISEANGRREAEVEVGRLRAELEALRNRQ